MNKRMNINNRRHNKRMQHFAEEFNDNKIIERLEDETVEQKTKHKNIQELRALLMKTCIDYVTENDLTDIDSIDFSLKNMFKYNKIDNDEFEFINSSIEVGGIGFYVFQREHDQLKVPYYTIIGKSY